MSCGITRRQNSRVVAAGFAHLHQVACFHLKRRYIDLAAVDLDMAVTHDLPGLRAAGTEAHPVDYAVEPAFQSVQQVFARNAFLQRGFLEIVAKLGLEKSVDAAGLLLFTKLKAIAHQLALTIFSMVAGNEVAFSNRALLAVAALTFQK